MRPWVKITLLIALALVVLGTALAGLAWTLGAHTSIQWQNGRFRIIERGVTQEFEQTLESFDRIDLRLDIANVTIQHGVGYHISGRYQAQELLFHVENGVLIVDEVRVPAGRAMFSIGLIHNNEGSTVLITVPSATVLDALFLEVGVGRIDLRNVAADRTTVTLGIGNIYGENVALEDTVLQAGMGNIAVNGALSGRNEMQVGTGNVTLTLEGYQQQFTHSWQTGVGNTSITGGAATVPVEQVGSLHVSVGMGNIRVTFLGS